MLAHPNKIWDAWKKINNTQYWYPEDTWFVPGAATGLELYIKGEKQANCEGKFFIPHGTLDTDVEVSTSSPTSYTFYGACTELTPCVGSQIQDWQQLYQPPFQEGIQKDFQVGTHTGGGDILFSIADTWGTCEQFAIFADGKELGKTHGPLTLKGDEKFNPANILGSKLWPGTGYPAPYISITHGGFFGTFRIPQGTQKITVKTISLVEKGVWASSYYGWRLDRPCS